MDETVELLEDALREGLRLLDEGRAAEARALLARTLAAAEPAIAADPGLVGELAEAELDSAFAAAESRTDEMLDATDVARAAIEAEGLADYEDGSGTSPDAVAAAPSARDPFATRTMAELLERQGDVEGARAIRSALEVGPSEADASATDAAFAPPEPGGPRPNAAEIPSADAANRTRIIATLESWLANLRRGAA